MANKAGKQQYTSICVALKPENVEPACLISQRPGHFVRADCASLDSLRTFGISPLLSRA